MFFSNISIKANHDSKYFVTTSEQGALRYICNIHIINNKKNPLYNHIYSYISCSNIMALLESHSSNNIETKMFWKLPFEGFVK